MKQILTQLFAHQPLGYVDARQVLLDIADGRYNSTQIAAFLTVYRMRAITVPELQGFRAALLDLCLPVDLPEDAIDLCGTGGDGKNTFNVSTLAALVVAGAGYQVIKHGNYGVSSVCGSSNVMAALGYEFSNDSAVLRQQLDTANICFLHAPLFHPAMKEVAPVRKALGMKTFFNMLGPLVNPAQPRFQLVGVFDLELARRYKYILQQSERKYAIVHTLTGYDEVSLTAPFRCITNAADRVLTPEELGFERLQETDLHGGATIPEAAKIFEDILQNRGTPAQNAAVIANAALAIQTITGEAYAEARAQATDSLNSGKAHNTLQILTTQVQERETSNQKPS